jgi:hypothetical protein
MGPGKTVKEKKRIEAYLEMKTTYRIPERK